MPRNYTPTSPQDELDSRKKSRFLRCLADNGGFIEQAIREAKTSRRFIADQREQDEEFDAAIRAIIDITNEQLLLEARRRAMGFDEPIVYQGKIQGNWVDREGNICSPDNPDAILVQARVTKFSDNLLMFYIKGRMPEFRDGPGAKKGEVKLSDDELNDDLRVWLREKMRAEKDLKIDNESTTVS